MCRKEQHLNCIYINSRALPCEDQTGAGLVEQCRARRSLFKQQQQCPRVGWLGWLGLCTRGLEGLSWGSNRRAQGLRRLEETGQGGQDPVLNLQIYGLCNNLEIVYVKHAIQNKRATQHYTSEKLAIHNCTTKYQETYYATKIRKFTAQVRAQAASAHYRWPSGASCCSSCWPGIPGTSSSGRPR